MLLQLATPLSQALLRQDSLLLETAQKLEQSLDLLVTQLEDQQNLLLEQLSQQRASQLQQELSQRSMPRL